MMYIHIIIRDYKHAMNCVFFVELMMKGPVFGRRADDDGNFFVGLMMAFFIELMTVKTPSSNWRR